ncbi:hypothetical protein JX266_010977 [Neoarthrinium moseri]|nr:hypothetical protein JX266_010977 [Neoarthrinium moseri]
MGLGLHISNALLGVLNQFQGSSRPSKLISLSAVTGFPWTQTGSMAASTSEESPEDGNEIDVRVFGIVKMGPEASKLFNLQPDMATVPFGWITAKAEYIVSDPRLKVLENSILVGNASAIVDANGVTIENRQSIVVATTAE